MALAGSAVAFVLHDGFSLPFSEVAEVLGSTEAAARQLASRARKAVSADPPPQPDPSHNEVVGRLLAAMSKGDLDTVVSLLHPDVMFTGDSNGERRRRSRSSTAPTRWSASCAAWRNATARRCTWRTSWGRQRRTRHLHCGLPRQRGIPGDAVTNHRGHRARRKGLRALGYRQPRQVQRLTAAKSLINRGSIA